MLEWINKGSHILQVMMQILNSGGGEGYEAVDQHVEITDTLIYQ